MNKNTIHFYNIVIQFWGTEIYYHQKSWHEKLANRIPRLMKFQIKLRKSLIVSKACIRKSHYFLWLVFTGKIGKRQSLYLRLRYKPFTVLVICIEHMFSYRFRLIWSRWNHYIGFIHIWMRSKVVFQGRQVLTQFKDRVH